MNSEVVLLLGRKDEPTDAVEEYCQYLCDAWSNRSVKGEIVRVPWNERGWAAALEDLSRKAASWRGRWIFFQYTALAWSGRGFPRHVPKALCLLKDSGARVGVVFHDTEPFAGTRAVDILRRQVQLRVMRQTVTHRRPRGVHSFAGRGLLASIAEQSDIYSSWRQPSRKPHRDAT